MGYDAGILIDEHAPALPFHQGFPDWILEWRSTVLPNGWDIHGKTGTGTPRKADGSEDEDHAYRWFVGWASKGGRTLVFARLIQDDQKQSPRAG